MISIFVAMSINQTIGRENMIPWRIRDDLVRLKQLTLDHTVILGRKTYESMRWYYDNSRRPMPGKTYIVVTHNAAYPVPSDGVQVASSLEQALQTAKSLGDPDIYILGGATIFEQALPYVQTIYLTEVQAEIEGDTFFPHIDPIEWQEMSREHHYQDERNEYDYDFVVLKKV